MWSENTEASSDQIPCHLCYDAVYLAPPPRLESDQSRVDCKQEKEADKEDQIVIRSLKASWVKWSTVTSAKDQGGLGVASLYAINGALRLKGSGRFFAKPSFAVDESSQSHSWGRRYHWLESDDVDSKQENEKDVDEDESHLLNLPLYVLSMVIEFSVGVEYLKFRSTCKRCYLAAPLISWTNGKASKRLQEYSSLSSWVIVFDKHKGFISFMDPLFGDKYFMKTSQELICDFLIIYSRYGWLLILKPDESLALFDHLQVISTSF
nr:Toll/interleukin-1 receptor (TIR) domain-containing protein [Tanacetum cinerariifolium]